MLPGTLGSDAEYLLNFMDHFGIEQFDVLGTSRGWRSCHRNGCAGGRTRRVASHPAAGVVGTNPSVVADRIFTGALFAHGRRPVLPYVHRTAITLRRLDFLQRLFGDPARIPCDSLAGFQAG
jgi:hypothetical protein